MQPPFCITTSISLSPLQHFHTLPHDDQDTSPGSPPGHDLNTLHLIATCSFGLESVVTRELEQLGYAAKGGGTVGRVEWSVPINQAQRSIIRANLWLRAADRVLIRLARFPVGAGDPGFDDLFNNILAIDWEHWLRPDTAFPVAGRCVRSHITSEPAVQRAAKRAIVERLRRAYELAAHAVLPETGAPVAIEVSLLNNIATVTLDTSGVGLHKRGYREGGPSGGLQAHSDDPHGAWSPGTAGAAIKETLASGLIFLSGWHHPHAIAACRPLADPLCGSGTIAIEAALLARNIAPGLDRRFAAEDWGSISGGTGPTTRALPGPRVRRHETLARIGEDSRLIFDPDLWASERAAARAAIIPSVGAPRIFASDISPEAIRLARLHASRAGVGADIHFEQRDVRAFASNTEYGVVVTNPPYGVRLGDERELDALYRALPIAFRRLPTWSFHIFTGRLDLEAIFGQPAARRRKMYNSGIECCLFSYLGPKPPRSAQSLDDHGATVAQTPDANEHADQSASENALAHASDDTDDLPAPQQQPAPAQAFGGLRARDEKEARELAACLTNTFRHLRKYASRGITNHRVYERDVPDVPLIIDRYEDRFHAIEYEREHSRTAAQQADWFDLMRRTIAQTAGVPIESVFVKEKHRQRGLTQHEKVSDRKNTFIVQENGLRFEVNLSDYIDTGLFLDHRLTRQMVREQSAGKRILNLFCYTGSFSVYAASGGAKSVTSVDLSNTYLDWADRNMRLNRLESPTNRFVRSDVLEFLRDHPRAAPATGAYDLAIVDPPTFSNSKSTDADWEVGTSYAELLAHLAPLMSPGGAVYFSTNFRKFKLDRRAVADAGFDARDISARTVPPEYRNRKVHYCWRMVNVGPDAAHQALVAQDARTGHTPNTPPTV